MTLHPIYQLVFKNIPWIKTQSWISGLKLRMMIAMATLRPASAEGVYVAELLRVFLSARRAALSVATVCLGFWSKIGWRDFTVHVLTVGQSCKGRGRERDERKDETAGDILSPEPDACCGKNWRDSGSRCSCRQCGCSNLFWWILTNMIKYMYIFSSVFSMTIFPWGKCA